MTDLTNFADILDVRDIIERVEELETEGANIADEREDAGLEGPDADWEAEEGAELRTLRALLEDLEGNGGDHQWEGVWYPVTLIRDSYFTEYAQELVQDIGDLPAGLPSYIEVDWEATARNIRMDYTSVEFDGVTYWYR
ncbi:hypothetical protein [Caballeronia sp. LZ032]|uniref:hypothetical protein n=1 Tax=Caballeronia sp. LZ032 TaxID=3038565 RepID=UPI00286527A6|nr:hypothetical protein [Caballeronia sp. LZ032]MDR5879003.1 hypothetical protein [Caballeronia sp. LZ032]